VGQVCDPKLQFRAGMNVEPLQLAAAHCVEPE
jgi:hypothetical protein